jgi:hypothetical protein
MANLSRGRTAVFLGAGASCFAGFPSVLSFLGSALPNEETIRSACSELVRRICMAENIPVGPHWEKFDAEKLFGWLEKLEAANKIVRPFESVIISNSRDVSMPVDDFGAHLRRAIARVYGHEVEDEALTDAPHNSLFELVEAKTPKDDFVPVFTTNYDTVLERLFKKWSATQKVMQEGVHVCTGFPDGSSTPWSPELFERPLSSQGRLIHLVKLHGSVTWKKDERGIVRDTGYGMPTDHDCVLYFGYKGVPEDEPFLTLHGLLKEALLRCKTFVVVGFRFADPYIRSLFDFALWANRELRVLCCLTRIPEPGSPLASMMAEFPGRVVLLRGPEGEPVRFGDQNFRSILEQALLAFDT